MQLHKSLLAARISRDVWYSSHTWLGRQRSFQPSRPSCLPSPFPSVLPFPSPSPPLCSPALPSVAQVASNAASRPQESRRSTLLVPVLKARLGLQNNQYNWSSCTELDVVALTSSPGQLHPYFLEVVDAKDGKPQLSMMVLLHGSHIDCTRRTGPYKIPFHRA